MASAAYPRQCTAQSQKRVEIAQLCMHATPCSQVEQQMWQTRFAWILLCATMEQCKCNVLLVFPAISGLFSTFPLHERRAAGRVWQDRVREMASHISVADQPDSNFNWSRSTLVSSNCPTLLGCPVMTDLGAKSVLRNPRR